MLVKKHIKRWIVIALAICLLIPNFSAMSIQAAATIQVNETNGTVSTTNHDGPQVKKVRVLKEANYLEIYWDRYVNESEAVDISNFILKNGDTTLQLEAKGSDWTNTLYFDKNNKEVAATSAKCMARLDDAIHMSSIHFYGEIDDTKDITLEIIGDTIKDNNGKAAQSAVYTNVPYISFYTQFVTSETGIVVKGDDTVDLASLEAAAVQIDVLLSKTETGIAENMAKYECSLAVYSPHQNVYMIPEHRAGFRNDMYDVEGYGGNLYNNCVSSIAEQNIIRTLNSSDRYGNTMYRNENILIHEFGHCVRSVGMDLLDDPTLKNEFQAVYNHAKREGLWPNTYAIGNSDEFFATMCTIWFNTMSEASGWNDGTRCPVNTKVELAQYDPVTYEFFSKILPDTKLPAPWDANVPDNYKDASYDANWTWEPEPPENKKPLKNALFKAELIDTSIYGDGADTILENAKSDAKKVYDDENASQLEIDLAVAKLNRIEKSLPLNDNNLAYNAKATTSFVSDWESLDAVNDGQVPTRSYNPSISRYGTWGNNSAYETLTYTWDAPVSLDGAGIYLWYDGSTYTNGGIKAPSEYYYEYLDDNSNWQNVANLSAYSIEMDKFNEIAFDKIITTALRVTLIKQTHDANGVGVMEWRVYGTFASADKTELDKAIKEARALDKDKYTPDSYNKYEKVIILAEKVINETHASKEEIDLAVNALAAEKNHLVLVPDDPEPVPEVLATFNFNTAPSADEAFDGGYAQAKGTYTLVEHEDGKAIKLDGNGQFLNVTTKNGSSLLSDCSEITISFQAKPDNETTNWLFFAAPNEEAQQYPYEHYIGILDKAGTILADRFDNNGSRPISATTNLQRDDWYFMTVVYNATETIIYVDGEEVSREPSEYALTDILGDNSVLYIGRGNWGNGEYYKGLIDNYTIYSRALTATEIKAEAEKYIDTEPEPTPEPDLPFVDVSKNDWFYDAVCFNYIEKTMIGVDETHFAPYSLLSRAQFALILYRIENEPAVNSTSPFTDITGNEWYGKAVIWAQENGIVTGYGNNCFGPTDLITREQMAVMMYRYAKYLKKDTSAKVDITYFTDAPNVSGFANESMKWAVGNGIIIGKGNGTTLDPKGKTTRSEAAIIIERFMN